MNSIEASELTDIMRRIIKITPPTDEPLSVGWVDEGENLQIKTPDGWTLVFFIDAGEVDYLDSANSPDGRAWVYYWQDSELIPQYAEELSDLISEEERSQLQSILDRWLLP